jgi:hypothetical protein
VRNLDKANSDAALDLWRQKERTNEKSTLCQRHQRQVPR